MKENQISIVDKADQLFKEITDDLDDLYREFMSTSVSLDPNRNVLGFYVWNSEIQSRELGFSFEFDIKEANLETEESVDKFLSKNKEQIEKWLQEDIDKDVFFAPKKNFEAYRKTTTMIPHFVPPGQLKESTGNARYPDNDHLKLGYNVCRSTGDIKNEGGNVVVSGADLILLTLFPSGKIEILYNITTNTPLKDLNPEL